MWSKLVQVVQQAQQAFAVCKVRHQVFLTVPTVVAVAVVVNHQQEVAQMAVPVVVAHLVWLAEQEFQVRATLAVHQPRQQTTAVVAVAAQVA